MNNRRYDVTLSNQKLNSTREGQLTQLIMRLMMQELSPEPQQVGWILRIMEFSNHTSGDPLNLADNGLENCDVPEV